MEASAFQRALPLLEPSAEALLDEHYRDQTPYEGLTPLADAASQLLWETSPNQRLGEIAPILRGDLRGLDDLGLTVRCLNSLRRLGIFNLDQLAWLTPSAYAGTPHVGIGSVHHLLASVALWALTCEREGLVPKDESDPEAVASLAAIAEAQRIAEAATVALAWMLPGWRDDSAPTVVREALALLADVQQGAERDLREVLAPWHKTLDSRDLQVFKERSGPSSRTLADIGKDLGITRERIRQIHVKAQQSLWDFCDSDAGYLVARCARDVRALAPGSPQDVVLERWPELSWNIDLGLRVLDVVVASDASASWDEDWICWRPLDELRKDLKQALHAASGGSGVTLDAATDVVVRLGLAHIQVERLLEEAGWWLAGDVYLPDSVSLQDQAFMVLRSAKEPLTDTALQDALWRPGSINSLRNQLAVDDRFVRTGPGEWGLVEWNVDEYDGILAEIEKAIDAAGGRARTDDIVDQIVNRFGVSPSSVRAYASRSNFNRRDGYLTRNMEGGGPRLRTVNPAASRRFFKDPTGTWWVRLDLSEYVLSGFSPAITVGASVYLGVQEGDTKDFTVKGHPVTINFNNGQPSMGSVGRLARAMRAKSSDHLFFAPGPVEGELRCRRIGHPTTEDRSLVLAALTGTVPAPSAGEATAGIAAAVGALQGLSVQDLCEHLDRRGDDEVAIALAAWATAQPDGTEGKAVEAAAEPEDFMSAMGWSK
ncbi:MAG: hypothetical protein JWO62_1182 [Acidimicrobiaceae bacterium]|nr:hypothetical protein [Acidimicrobiaceae bacterium]